MTLDIERKRFLEAKMNNENEVQKLEDDEISLIDLLAVVFKHKFLIIFTTLAALVIGLGYVILDKIVIKPSQIEDFFKAEEKAVIDLGVDGELYTSCGEFLLVERNGVKSIGIAKKLLSSTDFTDTLLEFFDFMSYYVPSNLMEPKVQFEEILQKYLVFSMDTASSTAKISFTGPDSEFAWAVADFAVKYVVEKIRDLDRSLLMKADFEEIALYSSVVIIEPEEAKEPVVFRDVALQDFNVKTGTYVRNVIIIVFAGFFLSIFAAFVVNMIQNVKADPEAMKKLRGEK